MDEVKRVVLLELIDQFRQLSNQARERAATAPNDGQAAYWRGAAFAFEDAADRLTSALTIGD